jgi:hypothetical protein
LGEFVFEPWAFMRERKEFCLLPIVIVLLLFGGLIVFTQGSAVAPFIYTSTSGQKIKQRSDTFQRSMVGPFLDFDTGICK